MQNQLRYYRFVAKFVDAVTTQALTESLHGVKREPANKGTVVEFPTPRVKVPLARAA